MIRIDKIRPYLKELNPIAHERVLSSGIMNYMGGCGKTTLTLALGLYAARLGYDVLFVDFDPQSNLTQRLGLSNTEILKDR